MQNTYVSRKNIGVLQSDHTWLILSFVFIEELLEEDDLIIHRVLPILPVMRSGTDQEIMVDLIFQQFLVEVVIHFEKEIAVTAIEDNSQLAVFDTVDLHDCRVTVPDLLIVALVSELLAHFPVVGERTDIDSATRASGGAKHILMTER